MPLATQILLISTVLAAAAFDLKSRRIPNWLCLSAVLFGLAVNAVASGLPGLAQSLQGFALAALVYMPLYLLRAMGAGDVKLMMAVGAIAGPANWFGIFLITAIVGGAIALILVLLRGRLKHTLWNLYILLAELRQFRLPHRNNPELNVRNSASLRLPHGVSIALGTIAAIFIGFSH